MAPINLQKNCTTIIGPIANGAIAKSGAIKFIEKISEKIPLSKMNITKIISVIDERNTNKISAEVLSEYMGITVRSANRILNTLCKYNVATITEEKTDNKRGKT